MTRSARRARPGLRRDGEIRTIRSGAVRYPETDARAPRPVGEDEWRGSGRILMPARDTGLALQGRLAREARRRERERRQRAIVAAVAIAGVALLALGWRSSSDRLAASQPLSPAEQVASASSDASGAALTPAFTRSGGAALSAPAFRAATAPDPTPIVARRGAVVVRLAVPLKALTEIGFHQASYAYATDMDIALPIAKTDKAKKDRSTHRDLTKQKSGPDAILTGRALTMWRSRPGKPDTAMDVGAKPGSDVLAPVSGIVVKVKRYKLYGTIDDYELHIIPDGSRALDCVIIHIDDLSVKTGDRVVAGVTRIASVRKLSDRETLQLAEYTRDGGDHVHVQLNNVNHPEYKGLEGAIDPDSVPRLTRSAAAPEIVR